MYMGPAGGGMTGIKPDRPDGMPVCCDSSIGIGIGAAVIMWLIHDPNTHTEMTSS